MTATHGREVAASIGYPRPEEAYICSLFRNLGEVLIARYYPREYSQILIAMDREKQPERAACLEVLHFTWDDIAMRIAGTWNLPRQISLCLDSTGRTALASPADRSLSSIAAYGQALTTALYRHSARLNEVHLRPVVDLKGNARFISPRGLHRIVNNAFEDTKETFSTLRIPINTLSLQRRVEAAQVLLDTVPAADAVAGASEVATDISISVPTSVPTHKESDAEVDLSPLILDGLEAVVRCGFERALFALLNEQRDLVRGRLGAGANIDATLARFAFPMAKSDRAMDLALLRRQDLLVNCSTDGSYSNSGLGLAFQPAAFALYPVIVDNLVIGCIYADVAESRQINLHEVRAPLGAVRDRIAAALKKVRSLTK